MSRLSHIPYVTLVLKYENKMLANKIKHKTKRKDKILKVFLSIIDPNQKEGMKQKLIIIKYNK